MASSATGANPDSTAESDNKAIVSESVYVFIRSGVSWIQKAYFKASSIGAKRPFWRIRSLERGQREPGIGGLPG